MNGQKNTAENGQGLRRLKRTVLLLSICNLIHKMTAQRLDQDEVSQTDLTDSLGRKQATTIINESGLYNLK